MILTLLVYLSYVLLFIFSTTCLGMYNYVSSHSRSLLFLSIFLIHVHIPASGLIYLAELVEEYAIFTKKIIRYAIIVCFAVNKTLIFFLLFQNRLLW